MATVAPTRPDDATAGVAAGPRLFAYRATRQDRTVVELHCFQGEAAEATVEAIVLSVRASDDAEPVRQRHRFPTREAARHFVDEALIALEYVGCAVHPVGA